MNNYINADIFVNMLTSGANNLYNSRKEVDALNVFPVPDGDTGTNMSMTITAMVKALGEHKSTSVGKAADTAGYATLRGARGNSGVILSQLFRGMAKGLKGISQCDGEQLANALKSGVDTAYRAVMNPTEGTILTVSREAAEGAVNAAKNGAQTIEEILSEAVARGNKALAMTTEMLPALKQAGVVDAGGKGWMLFLEGALEFIKTGEIIKSSAASTQKSEPKKAQAAVVGDIKYMYCTEFIVEKRNSSVNVDAFREAVRTKGDCMLVIEDDTIVKVHIHTNNPGFVLERAIVMGDMINIKIDNMKHQHNTIISSGEETAEPEQTAEATEQTEAVEEAPSEPEIASAPEQPKKKSAVAAVCVGEGFEAVLRDLGVDAIIMGGQTMNPSTQDILNAAEALNAENIYVFPNNKNIILAANQAKEISDKNIIVIPTKSVVECISAMIEFDAEKDEEANTKRMMRAVSNVTTGQVTYAVRNTVIGSNVIEKGDIIGICGSEIGVTGKKINETGLRLIDSMADEDTEFITIYYGEDIPEDKAKRFADKAAARYPDAEITVRFGGQPVYYYIIAVE